MIKIQKTKAFLRWAGSKKKIIPKLSEFWNNDFDTYIEPFVGSGQLFFSLQPKKAIISDINLELINTYRQIKKSPTELYYFLNELLPISKVKYYQVRSLNLSSLNRFERAARFIYLNRFCFNGLYRTNNSGNFNVPYSNYKTGNLPTLAELNNYSKVLRNTRILTGDFQEIIKSNVSDNDFIYMDPPYSILNKRIFNQYDPTSFGINDIKRLKQVLNLIHNRKSKFLLSYAYTKINVDEFKKWTINKIITQRNIAGFSDQRKKAAELLATNIVI